MARKTQKRPLFDPPIVKRAIKDAVRKLAPRPVARNPVMFVVEIGSILTTLLIFRDIVVGNTPTLLFPVQVTLWLWFTVLFANFAEAMAEGRGKAQADTLRKAKTETMANLIIGDIGKGIERVRTERVPGTKLRKGDVEAAKGRCRTGSCWRGHPGRWRGYRRSCIGRRIGHHWRKCPCHSRSRGRPLGGHGRDDSDLGLDQGAHPIESRGHVPGSDDRVGGGCRTAKDAKRDRIKHIVGRASD